ncbi:MAG: AEC family transporter [Propionibacteriaceae bacterium]
MQGVLAGFGTIGILVGVGFLLGQLRILDLQGQLQLARLAYFVASPALMLTVLADTDVRVLFSASLAASLGSVVVTAGVYILLAGLVWKRTVADTVVGTFSASYVNAGNLGLPMAAYALGDAALIAPMLLVQVVVLQPAGIAVLDVLSARSDEPLIRRVLRPLLNPLMLGSLAGVVLAVTGWRLPGPILDPLTLLGAMAIPAMLLAFGVSLRLGPRPGTGEPVGQVAVVVALKLVLQPLVGYLLAAHVLGLDAAGVLAVTLIAGLPTAQNVFVIATRYRRGSLLARDVVFASTLLSVPTLLLIGALLG